MLTTRILPFVFASFRRPPCRRPAAAIACLALFGSLYCQPAAGESGMETAALAGILQPGASGDADTTQPDAVSVPAGDPPAPGEPQIAPTLQPLTLATFDANPADDPSGIRGLIFVQNVAFAQPVHSGTAVTAFVGRRNMTLQADGTVINAQRHITRNASAPISFSFVVEADRRFKILVVARNQYGLSVQEVHRGHARVCADARPAPAVLGDCADYCLSFQKNGAQFEAGARYVPAEPLTILRLDVRALHPRGVTPSAAYHLFQANGAPTLPVAEYNALAAVDSVGYTNTHDFLCLRSESLLVAQKADGGLVSRAMQWRLLTPEH